MKKLHTPSRPKNFAVDANGDARSGISDIASPVGAAVSSSCSDDGAATSVQIVVSETTANIVADYVYLPATCRH